MTISHKHLKLERKQLKDKKLSPSKQMLPRLPILLAQVKAEYTSNNLLKKLEKIFIICMDNRKALKKYLQIY